MIISCHKCNKKFEIADKLISNTGRLLQCGSCLHQWHYVPENKIELTDQGKESKDTNHQSIGIIKSPTKIEVQKDKKIITTHAVKPKKKAPKVKKERISIISYLLVGIITLLAMIIFIDTFKLQLSELIPNIDFYLVSLYETLNDIFLFFKDLLK